MIVRVAERTRAAKLDRLLIATDDARIRDVVERAGFEAVMTPSSCASGTDRVSAAIEASGLGDCALVVNVQGDEPLIDPADIDVLIETMRATGAEMGTLARAIESETQRLAPHAVKVVTRADGRALYFSRAPIPHGARPEQALLHVGIYAYRPSTLRVLSGLSRSPLEIAESLEQLRALEHGIDIQVARCVSERPSIAIDVPEDVDKVIRVLRSERGVSQEGMDSPREVRSSHAAY
jgi:3-deoxy-manno-octulosonate cytidylyltransferase (CMP-KDO synthetase)